MMRPLRAALFVTVFSAGSFFFETFGLLASGEAWLASGFIAAFVVFCVPEPGTRRDPNLLIFLLSYVIASYGIFFKVRWWLASIVGSGLALVLCMLLFLASGVVLIVVLFMRRSNAPTDNAQ